VCHNRVSHDIWKELLGGSCSYADSHSRAIVPSSNMPSHSVTTGKDQQSNDVSSESPPVDPNSSSKEAAEDSNETAGAASLPKRSLVETGSHKERSSKRPRQEASADCREETTGGAGKTSVDAAESVETGERDQGDNGGNENDDDSGSVATRVSTSTATSAAGNGNMTDDDATSPYNAHSATELYVNFVNEILLHPLRTTLSNSRASSRHPYAQLDTISVLGYLKSKYRHPTVIEQWSPYEVAIFEASISEYGKEFTKIANEINTCTYHHQLYSQSHLQAVGAVHKKSVQDVIDFYYVWKQTSHYKKWKQTYISPHLHDPSQLPDLNMLDASGNLLADGHEG
jgi:hypothetical protein